MESPGLILSEELKVRLNVVSAPAIWGAKESAELKKIPTGSTDRKGPAPAGRFAVSVDISRA